MKKTERWSLSIRKLRGTEKPMKIMIEMSPEHYDLLLSRVSRYSMAYVLLKNGIVSGGSAKANRIIEIACEDSEANSLLHVARRFALKPRSRSIRASRWRDRSKNSRRLLTS
jgi:hypothetical protein